MSPPLLRPVNLSAGKGCTKKRHDRAGGGDLIFVGVHDAVDLLCFAWKAEGGQKLAKGIVKAQAPEVKVRHKFRQDRLAEFVAASQQGATCQRLLCVCARDGGD